MKQVYTGVGDETNFGIGADENARQKAEPSDGRNDQGSPFPFLPQYKLHLFQRFIGFLVSVTDHH